jgi:hypothetical protein
MGLFRKQDDGLEAQLRSRRAEPSKNFVRALAGRVGGESRWFQPKMRYALVAVLTAAVLVASASAGVFSVATTTAASAIHVVTKLTGTTTVKTSKTARRNTTVTTNTITTPATDQYAFTCGPSPKVYCPPQITPTNTSCTDFTTSTTPSLGQINYTGTTTIGQGINPGVFFFYAQITTTSANQVVTVTQSHSAGTAPLFQVQQGQAILWTSTCGNAGSAALINNSTGASFTVKTPGTYFISVKYSTKSIAGDPVPSSPPVTYTFTTNGPPAGSASVQLVHS